MKKLKLFSLVFVAASAGLVGSAYADAPAAGVWPTSGNLTATSWNADAKICFLADKTDAPGDWTGLDRMIKSKADCTAQNANSNFTQVGGCTKVSITNGPGNSSATCLGNVPSTKFYLESITNKYAIANNPDGSSSWTTKVSNGVTVSTCTVSASTTCPFTYTARANTGASG